MKEGVSIRVATRHKSVPVTADTDLPELLDDATMAPLILERNGERFRLSREEGIDYEPDPTLVRKTLSATAGSWADVDVDQITRELYEARRVGSRPLERP